MSMELTVDSKNLRRAMLASPQILGKHLNRAIGRVVLEMANSARDKAPRATSGLTNAILPRYPSPLVGEVVAGKDYARAVEEGTRGDGRIPGKRDQSKRYEGVLEWVKAGTGVSPRDPSMSEEDLAYVIARSIAVKGTPAQPFMAPAYEDNRAKAERRISQAIDAALAEIG